MIKRREQRRNFQVCQLEMTPMIDVVFQLLIFFIVALNQEDILSHLDVNRGAPVRVEAPAIDLYRIIVAKEGFSLHGRSVTLKELDRVLMCAGDLSKSASIVIKCTGDSSHSSLVQLLDICGKAGLKNVSLFGL